MHDDTWQLQEAKAKLSELVLASQKSPQTITVRGEEQAVVLSHAYYVNLQQRVLSSNGKRKQAGSFGDYLAKSPLCGANLHIDRDQKPMRDVKW